MMFPHFVNIGQAWPVFFSAGIASFVEMVEALTIVLAVLVSRGAKTALVGAILALLVLAVIIGIAGPTLSHINLRPVKLLIGVFLIWFGSRWLRKAILRASGLKKLHDEAEIFQHEVEVLSSNTPRQRYGIDLGGATTSFNGVLVEGIEVVMIVIAVGSTPARLLYATWGATSALLTVVFLGLLLKAPLTKIPENSLKLLVGVMLTSLGTLWVGESVGLTWPLGDWSLVGIVATISIFAAVTISILKRRHTVRPSES